MDPDLPQVVWHVVLRPSPFFKKSFLHRCKTELEKSREAVLWGGNNKKKKKTKKRKTKTDQNITFEKLFFFCLPNNQLCGSGKKHWF